MTAVLTALAVAGAIATVIISNWTLEEARNATGEARRTANEAHNQAVEAKRQADIAETAFKASNRPVIVTEGIDWDAPLVKDTANSIKIFYNNFGKDSTNAFVFGEVVLGPPGKWKDNNFDFRLSDRCAFHNYRDADTPIPIAVAGHSFHKEFKVSAADINAVLSGKSVAIRGCFFYGVFGDMLTTPFCYVAAAGTDRASQNESPLCAGSK